MGSTGYIVDFNSSDGLPPLVVQKLNHNFASLAGFAPAGGSGGGSAPQVTDYDSLSGRPSINSVTLTGNMTSSDLGLDSLNLMSAEAEYVTDVVPVSTIAVPIQGYDPSNCVLVVDVNGLVLAGGVDYTVSGGSITLTAPIQQAGQTVHFLVIYAE